MSLLCVDELNVYFETADETVHAVRDLSFRLDAQQSLAIVGESGSGKSQAVNAMLGLLAENGRATGSVLLSGKQLLNIGEERLRRYRGRRVSVVFQNPMTSLNPYLTIGTQLARVLIEQRGMSADVAGREVVRMLDAVQLPGAKDRLNSYPHEYSGGMRQRVMIAAALLCRPDILIADEPTTALDVTVQASILQLLRELQDAFHTALILISHDLAVVAGVCDRVIVMHDGQTIEDNTTEQVFANPEHSVTRTLLDAAPRLDSVLPTSRDCDRDGEPLVEVDSVQVDYPMPRTGWFSRKHFLAVRDVSFKLHPGETLGIVGESGCGKSSLARALLGVGDYSGVVKYRGEAVHALSSESLQRFHRELQIVFQDPLGSLNPRMTIRDIVAEPLLIHRLAHSQQDIRDRVVAALERVGLDAAMLNRYPHEFSGGQCQRIGIARALMTSPRVLICDEAVSALDVTVQAEILELLQQLRAQLGLAIVFIAHDLAVVRQISDRVAVMYLGRVVEQGLVANIYAKPQHPYTQALLDAAPLPDPAIERQRQRHLQNTELPPPWQVAPGCAYRMRCPRALAVCEQQRPLLSPLQASPTSDLCACHSPADAVGN
ncbi:MAG: ABC transporter ATP-binding protein [Pseudomonadota bacterium]